MKIRNVVALSLRKKVLKIKDEFFKRTIKLFGWGLYYQTKNNFNLLAIESSLRGTLFKHLFGKHAEGVIFKASTGLFISDPKDLTVAVELGHLGSYDLSKITYLTSLISKEAVVYILGTHIGTLAIPIAGKVKTVIAFEPNPASFEFLKMNIYLNKIENIQAINKGVFNANTFIDFYQNTANSGGSKIKPEMDGFIYNYDKPNCIQIEVVKLDDFIAENNVPFPDLMIVDIEGAEYAALHGGSKCLEQLKYMCIEFVPHHLLNVANITVDQFLSVILPYFQTMLIVGGSDKRYNSGEIETILKEYLEKGICCDLLFYK